jgi:hypothetical protein
MKRKMIHFISAASVAIAIIAIGPRSVQAKEAPWCAVINFGSGMAYWDCQYWSVEACIPNVLAGNRGFCNPNPAFQGYTAPRKKASRRTRRSQ